MTKAIIVKIEGDYVITAQGADLLSSIAANAIAYADRAEGAAEKAESSAAFAESVSGPTYSDVSSGLAATTDGHSFAVDNGDGTVTIYLNDEGVAVEQRTLATTAALNSPLGGAMIGLDDGAGGDFFTNLQQYVDRIQTGWPIAMLGVNGDETNESAQIQAAFNFLSAIYMATGKPQTVTFRTGVTYVCRLVQLRPGVDINLNGATILKTPADGQPETVTKWWRVFTTENTAAFNTDLACAHRIRIYGGTIDGNMANMDWTNNTYNQEQAMCLFVGQLNAQMSHKDQRIRVSVEDMRFQNNPSDGFCVGANVDAFAINIEADNCFRGGLVCVGGNSYIRVRNYVGENARVDFEVDGAGYGGTSDTWADVDGVSVDLKGGGLRPGGADLGNARGGKHTYRNLNIRTGPTNIGCLGSGYAANEFINCYFTLTQSVSGINKINYQGSGRFVDCSWFVKYSPGFTNYRGLHFFPLGVTSGTIDVIRPTLILDPNIRINEPSADCEVVRQEAVPSTSNLKVRIVDMTQVGEWNDGVVMLNGGDVEVLGRSVITATLPFTIISSTISGVAYPAKLTIDGVLDLAPSVTQIFANVVSGVVAGAMVDFRQTWLSRDVEAGAALPNFDVRGHYSFPVTAGPPSAFGAIRGAIAELNTGASPGTLSGAYKWVATSSSGTSSTWAVAAAV